MDNPPKKKGKIRQHYVPQFYLRNFGDNLYSFDKKTEKTIYTTPKNLAVKSNFYGGEFENTPSLEGLLSQLEGQHHTSMKKLIEKKDYYSLDHVDQIKICEFLGLQYLRTEQQRNDIRFMSDSILNSMFESIIPPELKLTHGDSWDLAMQLKSIKEYRRFAAIFFHMRFVIFENNTTIPFWTSDNPIAKQNEVDKAPLGTLGVTNSGIEIHLPLTPKLSLIALDPELFTLGPNKRECDKQGVIRENFLQLDSSKRFIYSQSKRFHIITSMLKNNTHYKDEDRRRFETIVGKQNGITRVLINAERNLRWPVDPNKPVLDELKTWISQDFIDKIMKDDNLA